MHLPKPFNLKTRMFNGAISIFFFLEEQDCKFYTRVWDEG